MIIMTIKNLDTYFSSTFNRTYYVSDRNNAINIKFESRRVIS